MADEEIKEMLRDLIFLNGLIATELLQITENTSAAIRGEVPEGCRKAHNLLREDVLAILQKNGSPKLEDLKAHLLGHG